MNNMRMLRKEKKMTMKQLGKIVGVSESAISMYETGKHEPDILTLQRIADTLGVSVDRLLGREEQKDTADEAWEVREQLRRDPNMRILFSAASKATPDQLRAAAAMLKALQGEDEDDAV